MSHEAKRRVDESCVPHLPYLADVGVIALVPEEWGSIWKSRHQILTRLVKYFHVVWCTPARWWRERQWWRELWLRGGLQGGGGANGAASPGLTIYYPERWLPLVGWPRFLACWNERQRLRRAQRILLNRGCRKIILYLWRPECESALDLIDHDLSCYHISDEYTFSESEQPIDAREARLISRVDQVFIHSIALLEKKGNLNPHTTLVPNGVDYRAYETPCSEPADLQPIPHPRIGYVGRIKPQLDLALLTALAQRHRGWSFVLVGPQDDNLGERAVLIPQLAQMPNVYLLGGKSVSELPAYTQHVDVCILCYRVNDYTKFIYPLKLHEYLATGRPVVGSPIRSLQDVAQIVRLARTADEWSQALRESLSPVAYSATQVEARRNVARQHDWNRLVEMIAHTLCCRLGPVYQERFREIPSIEHTVWSVVDDSGSIARERTQSQ
jgi:glycosyltransferase involved in cell wall biosynthesis